MTCFRALENPLSICHVLNSFSLKYSICHSAIFGGSLSWTPSAGTCTMWKTEMWVAILFIHLFVWFCMVGGRRLAYLWNQTFVPFSSWRETFGMVKPRAVSGPWCVSCGPSCVSWGAPGIMWGRAGPWWLCKGLSLGPSYGSLPLLLQGKVRRTHSFISNFLW